MTLVTAIIHLCRALSLGCSPTASPRSVGSLLKVREDAGVEHLQIARQRWRRANWRRALYGL